MPAHIPQHQNPEYIAAMRRVNAIRAFWSKRGFAVNAWVVATGYSKELRCVGYAVQTDLVGGLPPGISQKFLSRVGPSGRASATS